MEKRKKILIVEDEMVTAMDLQNCIEGFGYSVTDHVTTGEDVIQSVKENKPDIILMDIKLEGKMDGIETAEYVFNTWHIPVIFLSSFSNGNMLERAKRTHPFGYIIKPFNDRELFINIEIALYKQESNRKLRESERKYRELAESIQQIIIECDLDGSISYLNPSGRQLLGVNESDLQNSIKFSQFLDPANFVKIKQRLLSCKEQNTEVNREYPLKNKQGRIFFVEEYLSLASNYDGVCGFRGILFDVTSRKIRYDLNLLYHHLFITLQKEEHEPLQILGEMLRVFRLGLHYIENVAYFEYDAVKGRYFTYSEEGMQIAAGPHPLVTQVLKSQKSSYLHGEKILPFWKSAHESLPAYPPLCWMGFPIRLSTERTGVFTVQCFTDENAYSLSDYWNFDHFFISVNALFERNRHLEQIRKSETEYKLLVNSINEGMIRLDLHGRITFVNDRFCRITGYEQCELIGLPLLSAIRLPQNLRAKLKQELFGRHSGISNQYELDFTNKEGGKKTIIVNSTPYKNIKGEISGSIATILDVTEKKEYQRLMRVTEQKFKVMFDQAAIGVAILNSLTGEIMNANNKYCTILQYQEEELLGKTFMELTYPEDLPTDLVNMEKLLTGEIKEFTMEKRLFKKDGNPVWVNLTVSPLWQKGQKPDNHIAIINDISERKIMENELRQSELEKENILKSIPDSFLVVDHSGNIINSYFNFNERVMLPPQTDVNHLSNICDLFEPAITDRIRNIIRDCLDTARLRFLETEFSIKDSPKWFEMRFSRINESLALLMIRNVTAQKKNLLQAQKFYNITEQTHELILITDKLGRIEYINPTFSQVTGFDLSEVKGKHPSLFKSNKHSKKFYQDLWATILSGNIFKGEFVNLKKNGEVFIEEKIISPIFNEDRQIVNFISTGRDVTEEKKREKRLKVYQKFEKTLEKKEQRYRTLSLLQGQEKERIRLAREIHDGLGQMLTVANANLQNFDLNSIRTEAEIAKLELVREMVAEIIQESRRISHNLSPSGLEAFGLHAILEQFVKKLRKNYIMRKINFQSNIAGVRFKAEIEINLYRIIQEAIHNSLKHSSAKKLLIRICYENRQLRVLIKDNGIGLNVNHAHNRGSNGIKNMEERAKIMNGSIKIISQPGKGCEIELNIKTKQIQK